MSLMSWAKPFLISTNLTFSGCDSGWKLLKHTNKCYRLFATPKTTWHEAVKVCQSGSKHPSSRLVSIPDRTTNEFLRTLVNDWTWTGGHQDSSGTWVWLGGSRITYFNWHRGEPNNAGANEDYLIFNYGGQGLWSDDPPSKFKRSALCQYDL